MSDLPSLVRGVARTLRSVRSDSQTTTEEMTMNDIKAVAAGRIEDKWIEFVAAEFEARDCAARAKCLHQRTAACVRHVEVHASYLWLLAGAFIALAIR